MLGDGLQRIFRLVCVSGQAMGEDKLPAPPPQESRKGVFVVPQHHRSLDVDEWVSACPVSDGRYTCVAKESSAGTVGGR